MAWVLIQPDLLGPSANARGHGRDVPLGNPSLKPSRIAVAELAGMTEIELQPSTIQLAPAAASS